MELTDICLEPVSLTHLPDLLEHVNDPEIWQFMGSGNLGAAGKLKKFIESAHQELAQGEGITFAQIATATGKAVGTTSIFDVHPQHRRLEIGRTWLGRQFWRSSLNTQSKYLLLRHAFEMLDANRVTIKTDSRNVRSQRAIERIGGVREGVLRHHMVLWDGYVRDTVYFGIIKPEWPQTKLRIEELMERYAAGEAT